MIAVDQKESLELQELAADYAVLGELGRGGMAIVYLAKHRRAGHQVAIKVVRASYLEDEETVARFAREAKTVARMQHANIVRYYEIRRLGSGGLALVMQYVPGDTLANVLREEKKPLAYDRAERILRDIAKALAFAHGSGIVHRDVKPENIFVDKQTGQALLSDFGIAKSVDGDTDLTHTGIAIGTPTYMAPEQIDGAALNARSDLYSLGLVAWEMLAGARPWAGESLYSVLFKQKNEQLPSLDVLRPDIPRRFVLAVDGALRKNPQLRWASADEFLEQLSQDTPTGASQRRAPTAADDGTQPTQRLKITTPTRAGDTVQFRRPGDAGRAPLATPAPSLAALVFPTAPARWRRVAPIAVAVVLAGAGGAGAAVAAMRPQAERATTFRPTASAGAIPAMPAPETASATSLIGAALARIDQRDWAGANAALDSAVAAEPLADVPYLLRARVLERLGRARDAWSDAEIAVRLGARTEGEATSAMIDASVGDTTTARRRVTGLLRTLGARGPIGVSAGTSVALALLALRDTAAAQRLLERVPRTSALTAALRDPGFDPLRTNPRFLMIGGEPLLPASTTE